MKTPRVITIANHKGGVAKTTTAWHTAHHIAARGHNVLLIDMDPQANLSKLSGVVGRTNINSVLGGAVNPSASLRSAATYIDGNLSIITSDINLANTAHGLHNRSFGRYRALPNAINATGRDWDTIIIDAPPSADVLAINALAAADTVIIPSQPEPASIDGIEQTLNILEQVLEQRGDTLSDLHITVIATMAQTNTIAHQHALEALTIRYKTDIVIPLRKGLNADAQIREAYKPLAARLTWQGVPL